MKKILKLWMSIFLLTGLFSPDSFAQDFTNLEWKTDTTRLGISFAGACYPDASVFPHYCEQFDLGFDYADWTYTVCVEYPEYQLVPIPEGLTEYVKSLPEEPQPTLRLLSSAHRGKLRVDLLPFVYRNGKLYRLNSFRLLRNESTPAHSASVRGISIRAVEQEAPLFAFRSKLAEGKWVKISVPHSGVFQLTASQLKEIGFQNIFKVRVYGYGGALLAENLKRIHPDDLCEVPAYRSSEKLLFYGQGPLSWKEDEKKTIFHRIPNFYATAGYYFLTENEEPPLSMPIQSVTEPPVTTVTSFSERVVYEADEFSWGATGRELYEGYDYAYGNTKHYSFLLPGITQEKAYVSLAFAALSKSSTSVQVQANNHTLGTLLINGTNNQNDQAIESSYTGTWDTGLAENTYITLTHTAPAGTPGRLNYLTINYRRALKQTYSYLAFRDLNTRGQIVSYTIEGCEATTQIWDVTTPGNYTSMQGELRGNIFTFTGDNTSLREYVAVNTQATFETPAILGAVPNQNLHGLEKPDLVIIVPSSGALLAQAERLAEAHRKYDQMVVHVVTAAQVYNEFSSGTPDATAYRWFMKMFYERAGKEFGDVYLLLMGDCAYDNRMVSPLWKQMNPDDFLLGYQSANSTQERYSYVSDDYLGILHTVNKLVLEEELMDIAVGRFPVRNVEEARIAVDKTIRYMENKETGPWKNRVIYAADDEDFGQGAGINHRFMIAANKLATYTEEAHPEMLVTRIFEDAYPREATAAGFTYPQATKHLLSMIESGVLLVNYTGHGGPLGWSEEFLLTIQQIRAMRNSCLSVWVTATCDFCRFDDLTYSAGEEAFLNPRGGAVALFTTSRIVYGTQNDALNARFNHYIFNKAQGSRLRLGDIMRLSKQDYRDVNNLNFSLIGDPALRLAFPDHQVVLDTFNGEPVSDSALQMRAGDVITLRGHVADADGNLCTDFDGLVYPAVYDRKDTITTYNHVGHSPKPYKYAQYQNKLFSGSDSVKAGNFEITFPVPLDISYSHLNGMINFYAVSSRGEEGNGVFTDFVVGGTAPGATDSDGKGPDIYLYLNTPDFPAGGVVNPTPRLYAELIDEDGINAAGNGIGHDIQVSIDHSPLQTFVLNDYFQLAPGGYTRGTVHYQFDGLTEGDHTLYFTAWDTRNNSSTYELPFRVQATAAPMITGLTCYPVPAVTDLTFHFSHDRPGTDFVVQIEVFAFSGAPVWSHTLTDQSSDGYYTYTWDLTSGQGNRLPPGVYLYRARFSTAGSEETTQTLKFVIGTP